MEDEIEKLREKILKGLFEKKSDWVEIVYNSQQYQQEIQYLKDITDDFIYTIRSISFYSIRAEHIYKDFLCIRVIDDLLQSAVGIFMLIENGIHNTVRRELRYLIELITKYVIVDYAMMGKTLEEKLEYLKNEVPNSSLEIVDNYSTPFNEPKKKEFQSEIKDFFYKACAYVHPSKKQTEEQIENFSSGNTIGFESAKMFSDINKVIFRAYDMILVMMFHDFGPSMSSDLFEQLFNENPKWKYHKGKYVKEYVKIIS